jgi:hypothetical protein
MVSVALAQVLLMTVFIQTRDLPVGTDTRWYRQQRERGLT